MRSVRLKVPPKGKMHKLVIAVAMIAVWGNADVMAEAPRNAGAGGADVLIECEQFKDPGGWSLDSQFIDEMGSSYLLAHGLGNPVADAKTTFEVAKGGRYSAFVRTKNWTAKWSGSEGAGRFNLVVNGVTLPNHLGVHGRGEWLWMSAGDVMLNPGTNTLALHDITGFDGRCDAICFTTTAMNGWKLEALRGTRKDNRRITTRSDLVVVGGGIAGICTAISAARLGLKVALVQDRPVLGGANSSEVRVHLGGRINLGEYPRLGDVVAEIGPAKGGNAQPAVRYEDARKMSAVRAERNIGLFLNTRVVEVESRDDRGGRRIGAVVGRDVVTGAGTRFEAPLFVDCTGDGCVGFLAGAEWRIGREARSETGEDRAPEKGDGMTMGASCQWYAEKVKNGSPRVGIAEFPNEPWMIRFNEDAVDYALRGDWDWETGMNRDQLKDFETVRDYAMLVAYSNWNHVKNVGLRKSEFADAQLVWVAFVAGKRETRRLMGDHVLCQQDIFENRSHPDGTCWTTWSIDLHYPMPSNQRNYDGEPFRSICRHSVHSGYPIPYRCLYSRNVSNLFMAGRDISVTHVALGTTRVMRTHGMMGEVVGMAASICKKHGCDPRGVYTNHLDELKMLMSKGVGLGKPQPLQDYNLGGMRKRKFGQ